MMSKVNLRAVSLVFCILHAMAANLLSGSVNSISDIPGEFRPVTARLEEHMRRHNERNRQLFGSNESCYIPFVTLTYAQTIDGSIAALDGNEQLILSSKESMTMTHHLRSMHDVILVGVQTVQSDNPSLTVRLCSGKNPQPVILDSKLSINSSCRFEPFAF
jgi:hypothetical protein